MPSSAPRHRPRASSNAQPPSATRKTANARGYTYRWQRYAYSFLRRNPLCVTCKANGLVVAAKVVDHIRPHRGDQGLFWYEGNHQALCLSCHGAKSAREKLP